MSDNRTTELLCKMLDERGVKWYETQAHGTSCIFIWWNSPIFGEVHATANDDGTLFMTCLNNRDFTPEQAIAATLGSERERELEQLVRDTRNALYFMYNIRNDKLSAKRMNDIDKRIAELGIEVIDE